MKLFILLLLFTARLFAQEGERASNTILLDEQGVENLRIETVVAEEQDFETTLFAIGRIEEIPNRHSVLSSRISGRVISVNAFIGDTVKAGQILINVESRQPGNPPPTISITTPRSGIVMESHVKEGEPVSPEEELMDVIDLSKVWAIAKIPENAAATLQPGSSARVTIPAVSRDPIFATLLRFGVQADRNAGTVDAIFEIDNSKLSYRPGMRAEFAVATSSRSDVLAVPRAAIQGDPSKRIVYIKDFELENAFVKSPVVLGVENDQYVEVISGVFPGDEVVTTGSYFLGYATDSTKLSLKEALDAAHGHEHNEDGSEMTPEQKKSKSTLSDHPDSSDHHHHGSHTPYLILSGVLAFLLLIAAQQIWTLRKRLHSQ